MLGKSEKDVNFSDFIDNYLTKIQDGIDAAAAEYEEL
jgi:hypothetical protein